MHILIPTWFYGFDSAMYLISAFVGFILSFYFYKIYSLSSEKRHNYLYLGFFILSIGLLTLSITNTFSYITLNNCAVSCQLGLNDTAFSFEDFSYFVYFGLSIFAYSLFIFAYIPEDLKKLKYAILLLIAYIAIIIILLPMFVTTAEELRLWYTYHEYFHLTAFIMLTLVTFRAIVNYSDQKSFNSLLVVISFLFLSLFHLLHIFSFVSEWMYVYAHISLLAGFTALLAMLLQVKNR